jgi:hypothetical protein
MARPYEAIGDNESSYLRQDVARKLLRLVASSTWQATPMPNVYVHQSQVEGYESAYDGSCYTYYLGLCELSHGPCSHRTTESWDLVVAIVLCGIAWSSTCDLCML